MLGAANNAAIRSAIGLGQTDAPTFNSLGVTNTATANVFSTSAAALQTAGYLGVARAINLIDTAGISWSSTSTLLGATGTNLLQDAAGILAQRNGTAKQTLRIYNTYTSATVYERAVMDWNGPTPGNLQIGTEFMGSGSGMAARPIDFVVGGVVRMSISSVLTQIIGNVGVTGYVAGTLGFGGWFNLSGNAGTHGLAFGSGHMIRWGSATTNLGQTGDLGIGHYADGVAEINNATAGVFRDLRVRSVIQKPPATITPASNGDLVVEATSNTLLTFKFKGSDGTVRSGTMVVA
jgi:hypothetical protein